LALTGTCCWFAINKSYELEEIWQNKVWQNFDIGPTKEKYLKIVFLESMIDAG
jgi:hypothetical protein